MAANPRYDYGSMIALLRILALSVVAVTTFFLINSYLIHGQSWPGLPALFGHLGWFGIKPPKMPLEGMSLTLAWTQLGLYVLAIVLCVVYVVLTRTQGLRLDSARLSAFAAFVVRGAFWSVFLVGLADMVLSFLRVEDLLADIVGHDLAGRLGRSRQRGLLVHFPLIGASFIIALFTRSLGFIWLAFLVVIAEFQIVISRFVFSYEQVFMGDLVRFWYAGLFLFASAYGLIEEGHVRVDVLYTSFTDRGKAWTNALGSALLGLPLCLTILILGMSGQGSSILSPLMSFEISQSGFGMYVKYLMAGFLLIFAFSMAIQFMSYFLENVADLKGEPGKRSTNKEAAH